MATPTSEGPEPARRRVPLGLALVLMVLVVVIAALILARVAGPLYGLLFPAQVPVPERAEEIEHVKPERGAEYWIYRTSQTGREVAAFYEREGGACQYSAQQPMPDEPDPRAEGVSYSVAFCRGKTESAGSRVSWEVSIAEGYTNDEGPTVFRIYKFSEVN